MRPVLFAGPAPSLAACRPSTLAADGPRPAPPGVAADEADVYAEGMAAWRARGAVLGATCANCHAPDALDLAYSAFSDDDLRRRGAVHLPPAEVEKIVALVALQRERLRIRPRDPRADRPFQPGGRVLAGETVPERDLAFARQLDGLGLTAPVLSRADALAARDAWLAVDARALPVGIAFNRWSEDPDHGDASLADWLPDLPRLAPGDQAALFAAHDRYLAGPSDAALVRLIDDVDAVVERSDPGTAGRLFDQKHRSVLVAQHLFRGEVASGSLWGDRPTSAFFPLAMEPGQGPNPVWEVGTFARDEKHGRFELPDAVLARTSGDLRAEMTALRVPWFWAGWTFDQGLQRTHGSNSTKSAEYLLHHLDTDYKTEGYGHGGYRAHAAFAVTKRVLHEQFGPAAQARAYRVALSNFAAYDRAWTWSPTDDERGGLYVALTANAYRMLLHLALAEADAGRPVDHEHVLRTAGVMETFFEWAQTEHVEADRALVAEVRARWGGAA